MLVISKLLNIAVNDADAKKSAHYSQVLAVTELVVSGTQCSYRLNIQVNGTFKTFHAHPQVRRS